MLEFQDWGLIDYEQALNRQLELVEKVAEEKSHGYLIFCTHEPVVTLGRKTQPGDVFSWKGPVKEISRGGRATYHGPSQLVIYPILNMDFIHAQHPQRDIGWFLRSFENAIVQTLKNYGIEALGKSLQQKSLNEDASEETGVWVGRQKIGSLGIGVRKWVTYHGAAINLDYDPEAFIGMKPCGFHTETMVSLEKLLGRKIDRQDFSKMIADQLQKVFQ